MGTHRELSKRSLRAKKRPVRAKNGQLERKKGQFERKNGQVERKSAFEVPSGLPKNFKSVRRRQLRASKSVMRAAKTGAPTEASECIFGNFEMDGMLSAQICEFLKSMARADP